LRHRNHREIYRATRLLCNGFEQFLNHLLKGDAFGFSPVIKKNAFAARPMSERINILAFTCERPARRRVPLREHENCVRVARAQLTHSVTKSGKPPAAGAMPPQSGPRNGLNPRRSARAESNPETQHIFPENSGFNCDRLREVV